MATGKTNAGGGGDKIFPDEIVAGGAVIRLFYGSSTRAVTTYGSMTPRRRVKVLKSGTYRFYYELSNTSTGSSKWMRLTKNDVEVANSTVSYDATQIKIVAKTIDLALQAGDEIEVEARGGPSDPAHNQIFVVLIVANELQGALDEITEQVT